MVRAAALVTLSRHQTPVGTALAPGTGLSCGVLAADDTPPELLCRQAQGWCRMPPAQKAQLVDAWSADCRTLALAGLRERHPGADDEELRRRLAALLWGDTLAREAFGGGVGDARDP
jgi:hypothetical protein